MPPLATIEIPVIDRKSSVKPRMYDNEEPLPVKPSAHAPKNARIISRTVDDDGVAYNLKISDVDISDVGVEEILEYVSALELEDFENREFEMEREVLRAIRVEDELVQERKRELARQKARSRGTVAYESDAGINDGSETPDEAVGRHGRDRPTYTQFYLKAPPLATGSTPDIETRGVSRELRSESESRPEGSGTGAQQKRRRRKRDPVTGELIPLETVTSEHRKRPRRRRHPITKELMPLGWRYDPDASDEAPSGTAPSSFKDLSISEERDAKRVKLQTDVHGTRSPVFPSNNGSINLQSELTGPEHSRATGAPSPTKLPVVQILSSDDDMDEEVMPKVAFRQTPRSPTAVHNSNFMVQSALQPSGTETSPETEPTNSRLETEQHLSGQPIHNPNGSDGEDNDGSDEGWFVEDIVGHSWSDPKTHPTEFGSKPVTLYHVKWAGLEKPTWEPIESFDDISTVNEYRKRVGLDKPATQATASTSDTNISVRSNPRPIPAAQNNQPERPENRAAPYEGEYEVEAISAHHLSDPRTHSSEIGKKPVMLYKVKWKGYDEQSWEPDASFEGSGILRAYQKRHGLIHS